MTHQPSEEEEDNMTTTFDYVIVGAGPSAMGLLYGLLSPYHLAHQHQPQQHDNNNTLPPPPPPFTIAVLERGEGPPHDASTWTPSDWAKASLVQTACGSGGRSVEVLHSTLGSSRSRGQRVMEVPTGKGLGGTTNINACLCTPPSRWDFETWPAPWKETMLPSVHVIQDAMMRNGALQHHCQPLSVPPNERDSSIPTVQPTDAEPWREAVFPSLVCGVPTATAWDNNDKGGQRQRFVRKNYHQALVEPLLAASDNTSNNTYWKDCITFIKGAQAQRLLVDDKTTNHVMGVEYHMVAKTSSQLATVHARRDVILCAGAIETPALLLVSGIGHEDDLMRQEQEEDMIRPITTGRRVGVGRRLRDHVLLPKLFLTPWRRRSAAATSPTGVTALAHIRMMDETPTKKKTDTTTTSRGRRRRRFQVMMTDAVMFSHALPHHGASLVRRVFVVGGGGVVASLVACLLNAISYSLFWCTRLGLTVLFNYTPLYFVASRILVAANIVLLNPQSTGTVSIRRRRRRRRNNNSTTTEPLRRRDVQVVVDLNYLSDPEDIASFAEGFELSEQVFDMVIPKRVELLPAGILGWFGRRQDLFSSYARQMVLPFYHWCGTCAMKMETNTNDNDENGKNNEEWVVDAQLRLRGFTGIRICDASVFPTTVCGPTALTCAGLGHGLSLLMRRDLDKKER